MVDYSAHVRYTPAMSDHPVEYEYIDPSFQLDPYHPANESYFRTEQALKRAIVDQSLKCRQRHVEIAKLRVRGLNIADIAEQASCHPQTVGHILKRPEVKELIELLHHLSLHLEGPSIELRKRKLWEMAIDNQQDEPKTAISAIQEMNRMDGVGKDVKDSKIEITINNQLGRGPLDA